VIADLPGKVMILDHKDNLVASQGKGESSNKDSSTVRNQVPGTFVSGRFGPHGACFDHEGNRFMVEAGPVTRLRAFG
jgi:hypothetical protein